METREQQNGILEGVIWKQLLFFFFPILIGTFFQQLYNTVDTVIVGQFAGKEALSSVGGSSSQIINMVVGFFTGLTAGGTVLISQAYGASHRQRMEEALHTSYAFGILGGIGLGILGVAAAPAILRAIGDSKRPLYYLVVCCMVNIVLDLILVLYCGLGVLGVAVATLVSQAISAGMVTWTLMHKVDCMTLSFRKIRIHREVLVNMLQIGFPSGLQASMYSISNMIVQAALNLLGVDTMAAWTAYGKIDSVFWMINSSFGIALTTFVGQNFGAGKWERVKKGTRVCLGMAVGTAVCLTAALMTAGRFLLGIFTGDAAVVEIGMTMMYNIAPFFVMFVFIEIFSGSLRAQGYTFVTTVISVLGVCVYRIIWVSLITPGQGLKRIVACYPISWIVCAVLVSGYYFYKQKRIIARMEGKNAL